MLEIKNTVTEMKHAASSGRVGTAKERIKEIGNISVENPKVQYKGKGI